ncbi:MAG: DUF4062 domain-containing protein [Planctomycetota bacterium]
MIRIFVSATTADLGDHRQAVTNLLLGSDFQPVVQPSFPPDHRPLSTFLRDTISSCDIVICLIGFRFGAFPDDPEARLRSYTQLEYDYARDLKKPVFIFTAAECYRPVEPEEPKNLADAQEQFRASLLTDQHLVNSFHNIPDLERLILRAQAGMRRLAGRAPIYFRHLPPAPACFFGRQEEMNHLRAALARRVPSVIAVIGLGGQGKTSLVHHVLRDRYDYDLNTGFWCTAAATGYPFDLFLDNVLDHLSSGEFDKQKYPTLKERVTELLRYLQLRPTLLVIDRIESWLQSDVGHDQDVNSKTDRSATCPELDDFLNQATALNNGSHVVLTSRVLPACLEDLDKTLIPVRAANERRIGLEGLDPKSATQLLRMMAVRGSDETLMAFSQRLGYHPLALRLCGAFVARNYGGDLSNLPPLSPLAPAGAVQSLFREIDQHLPAADRTRQVLQILAPSSVAVNISLLQSILRKVHNSEVIQEHDLRRILTTLGHMQLVDYNSVTGITSIHPLVQSFYAKTLSSSETRQIHQHYSDWYAIQPLGERCVTLEDMQPRILAIEHALMANDLIRVEKLWMSSVTSLYTLIRWFAAFGHFTFGRELLTRAIEGLMDNSILRFHTMRSALSLPIGLIDQAIEDETKVIEALGAQDEGTGENQRLRASALNNRGIAHLRLAGAEHYQAAMADFDQAHRLYEQIQGTNSSCAIEWAGTLTNRGNLAREMGRLSVAIADHTEAIEIHQNSMDLMLRKINPDLASSYSNRGNAYLDSGKWKQAYHDYESAIEILESLLAIGNFEYRSGLMLAKIKLAIVLQRQKKYSCSIALFDEAIQTLQEIVAAGKRHFELTLAYGYHSRAVTLSFLGNHEDAVVDSDRAREILNRQIASGRKEVFGHFAHVLYVSMFVNNQAGNWELARAYQQAADAVMRKLIAGGENDVRILGIRFLSMSAYSLWEQQREEAESLIDQAAELAWEANRDWREGKEVLQPEIKRLIEDEALHGMRLRFAQPFERLGELYKSYSILKEFPL